MARILMLCHQTVDNCLNSKQTSKKVSNLRIHSAIPHVTRLYEQEECLFHSKRLLFGISKFERNAH